MISKECKDHSNYLLEALINIEYGMGVLEADRIDSAVAELRRAEDRISQAMEINPKSTDLTIIRANIRDAIAGANEKNPLSAMSNWMVVASRNLQGHIPEAILNCGCTEIEAMERESARIDALPK
jgi:hypothetical protein